MASGKNRKRGSTSGQGQRQAGISIRRFAVTYLILMGAFFFLIGFVPFQKVLDLNGLYTEEVVMATAKVLGLMSIPCTSEGSLILLPSIALDVKFGCNGLEAVMIYSVAVIAFPSPWKKRLIGIAAGFAILQAINILRIAFLAYSGIHLKYLFEYIHIYIAQGMMIAISLGIFFIYLNYAQGSEETA